MAESWKEIPAYQEYEASSIGRIRRRQTQRVLKPKLTTHGYYVVSLAVPSGYRCHNVHRLIAMAFLGMPPSNGRWHACHNNGDRLDNRAENLRWDTPKANTRDKIAHGTMNLCAKGAEHWNASLNDDLVRESAAFGIPKITIYQAVVGKTWGHVA